MEQDIESKKAFVKDLCQALKKVKQPSHDEAVKFSGVAFDYATLSQVLTCLKPLHDHGIFFTQNESCVDGQWVMNTRIFHVSGHEEKYTTFLKNNTQSEKTFAASITYSRRYALCSIFGLYGQKDIDAMVEISGAQKPTPKKPQFISKKLQDDLKNMMNKNLEFRQRLEKNLAGTGLKTVEEIPVLRGPFFENVLQEFSNATT